VTAASRFRHWRALNDLW